MIITAINIQHQLVALEVFKCKTPDNRIDAIFSMNRGGSIWYLTKHNITQRGLLTHIQHRHIKLTTMTTLHMCL